MTQIAAADLDAGQSANTSRQPSPPERVPAGLTLNAPFGGETMFPAAKHQKNMLALLAACLLAMGGGLNDARAATSSDSPRMQQILSLFEDISEVPRCSKNEERISAWLVAWAEQRGLAVESDNLNNVLITLHASPGYERRPGVVLQAHMDMVCQKAEGSPVVRQPSSSNNA